jgi:exopolysaccharide biosynthesis polyprenyl glycosylphosphotransferase
MLRQRARLVARLLFVVDALLVAAAFGAAYWARDRFLASAYGGLTGTEGYLWLLGASVPLWGALLRHFGLYGSFRTRPLWAEPWALLKVAFWATLLLSALTFALRMHDVSRLFLAIFGASAFGLLVVERFVVRTVARRARRRGYNYRNVLVVGTGRRARDIAAIIEEQRHWGFRLLGLVADGPASRGTVGRYPVAGTVDAFDLILAREIVDEVIFAVSRKRLEELEPLFLRCEELGIRAHVAVNFLPHMIAKVHLEDLHGIPLLTFSTTPQDEWQLALKRAFDIVVSGGLLLALSPLLVAIAAAVRLSSPGPVLFRQKRLGLNGRLFTLYKFRSMVQDAEARRAELLHLNEMQGPVFKISRDPRLTPIGSLLRRLSVDELPQLINVLRGDMSIVGPRPPLPEEVAQYQSWQRRRLSMKPGLTCLWQVHGRSRIADFDRWMELDLQYIDNWSLRLDLKIFLRTIPMVLLGRGAA